jgi:DNA-binding beta-propeller fold protein YncE
MVMPQAVAPKSLVLSSDGRYAFISDTPANRIIKIDVESGFIERTTGKRLRPGKLFFFPGLRSDFLAALAPSESAVYLLDPESLQTRFVLPVNGRPAGMARVKDYLYISDISSDKVALYRLDNGRLLNLIRVGRAPLDLVAEGGRVYASVSRESYLALLMPPLVTPVRRIRCRFRPAALAISRNWQKIYAANQSPFQLEVIDLQAGASLRTIPLPGSPDQIILWQTD